MRQPGRMDASDLTSLLYHVAGKPSRIKILKYFGSIPDLPHYDRNLKH